MAETTMHAKRPEGLEGIIADWSSDQRAFKRVSWGKAMMWIFLLSDTFVFSIFLLGYMSARMSTPSEWPNTSEVFSLHVAGVDIALAVRKHAAKLPFRVAGAAMAVVGGSMLLGA